MVASGGNTRTESGLQAGSFFDQGAHRRPLIVNSNLVGGGQLEGPSVPLLDQSRRLGVGQRWTIE